MNEGQALQDVLKVGCFGCGTLNPAGLHIKSRWEADELVCRWTPPAHHIGHPGVVYGGSIASVADCHSIWTAMATYCQGSGVDITETPPFVTGTLTVNYLKPARISEALELRARVMETHGRRSLVRCSVLQQGEPCTVAEVVAVRVDPARFA